MSPVAERVLTLAVQQARRNCRNVLVDSPKYPHIPLDRAFQMVREVNEELLASAVNSALLIEADARRSEEVSLAAQLRADLAADRPDPLGAARHDAGSKVP